MEITVRHMRHAPLGKLDRISRENSSTNNNKSNP